MKVIPMWAWWKISPLLTIFSIQELENYTTVQAHWESEICDKEQGPSALFQQHNRLDDIKQKHIPKLFSIWER